MIISDSTVEGVLPDTLSREKRLQKAGKKSLTWKEMAARDDGSDSGQQRELSAEALIIYEATAWLLQTFEEQTIKKSGSSTEHND